MSFSDLFTNRVKIRYASQEILYEQDNILAGTEMATLDVIHSVNGSQVIHGFIVSRILSESLVISSRMIVFISHFLFLLYSFML